MTLPVTFEHIKTAQKQLSGKTLRTPSIPAPALGQALGLDLTLKLENLQLTGSFKVRGAYMKLSSLTDEERARRHRPVCRKPRTGRGIPRNRSRHTFNDRDACSNAIYQS